MSFLTVEEIVQLRKNKPAAPLYHYVAGTTYAMKHGPLTPIEAQTLLDNIKDATIACQNAKINRPWLLVNLGEKLDPSQPWLGFELECGWSSRQKYTAVVNHVLDNMTHVVIDREGNDRYPTEITFPPQNYNDFVEGKSQIQKFYDWLNETKVSMTTPSEYCGTHVNISTPAYRAAGHDVMRKVTRAMNDAILMMPMSDLKKAFGRVPYGLGGCMNGWVEFKVFRSTDDPETFKHYLEVSKVLAEVMESLVLTYDKWVTDTVQYINGDMYQRTTKRNVIVNLAEILAGTENEPKFEDIYPAFGWGSLSYGQGDSYRGRTQQPKAA